MPIEEPSPKHLLDSLRLIIQAQDDFVDLRNLLEQIDLIVEKRPVEDRHDRLRRVDRQRAQPRALAPARRIAFMTIDDLTR